jgi:hypothetical protein
MTSANGGKPNLGVVDPSLQPTEEERSIPLMMGVAGRPDGISEVSGSSSNKGLKKVFNQGTFVIIAVVFVGAAILTIMRVGDRGDNQANPKTAEIEIAIDVTLEKLEKQGGVPAGNPLNKDTMDSLFNDTNKALTIFALDPAKVQIPVEYVKKDPFFLSVAPQAVTATSARANPGNAKAENTLTALRSLEAEVSAFDLQSVMTGSRPIAIINGEYLQPGQTIGSFTIKSIDPKGVELENNGSVIRLDIKSKAQDFIDSQNKNTVISKSKSGPRSGSNSKNH